VLDSFTTKISEIFAKLRRSGILQESDVDTALREIRIALLEADVSLDVAKKFIADVREKAIGQEIVKSIAPGQMVVKLIHDHLVALLGEPEAIDLSQKPHKIMLIGLQGAGKTTTAGKLAKFFTKKNKKVVLTSTDIHRPAALEQLRVLAQKIAGVVFAHQPAEGDDDAVTSAIPATSMIPATPAIPATSCGEICRTALSATAETQADVLIVDTAGRLHIDDVRMEELQEIEKAINPEEVILVVDIMTGQDAINIARKFGESIKITGLILTRVDGQARGGVALSMRALIGCGIKFLCTGERLDDLEFFDPERIASRLLGMGDIVSLVEKAQENFSQQEAENTLKKMQDGIFTFDDFADQMEKMSKLGGLKTIVRMLPQGQQIEKILEEHGASDKMLLKSLAIIGSMTRKEKKNYKLINGSRRRRIAAGSGTSVQDVNKLIKQYEGALDIFKKFRKSGGLAKMMMGQR
jgi:signal recognition particle subunit SRP54